MAATELATSTIELSPTLGFRNLTKTGFSLFTECFHAISTATVLNYKTLFFTKASCINLILQFWISTMILVIVSSAPSFTLFFCLYYLIFWCQTSTILTMLTFTPWIWNSIFYTRFLVTLAIIHIFFESIYIRCAPLNLKSCCFLVTSLQVEVILFNKRV